MLRLSIVIPVYNLEGYISETLDSCLEQNIPHSDYEIICINDGSTDNSESVILGYAERYPNIRLFTQENAGVSAARNRGISLAEGRYIWFVDGDDIIASNCLSELLSTLEKSDIDILKIGMQSVSNRVRRECVKCEFEIASGEINPVEFLTSKGGNGGGVCSQIYRSSLIRDKLFNREIKYSEDVLFSYKAAMHAEVCARTDGVFYYYYQRPGSAMHSKNHDKFIESMHLLAREYRDLEDSEPEWSNLSRSKRHFAVKALVFALVQKGDVKAACAKLRELRGEGLYPYPLLWGSLRGNTTAKQTIINLSSFLFPWRWYCMLCVRLSSMKKNLRRKKK